MSRNKGRQKVVTDAVAGVAFDLDGTLIDSMDVHYEAYRIVLAEHGVTLSRAHFDHVTGGKASEVIPELLGKDLPAEDLAALHEAKLATTQRVIEATPPRLLVTSCLLPLFAGRVPVALVTSGSSTGTETVLDALRWRDYFDTVITGTDVERGKPDAEPYLLAAERLGLDPAIVLAFEDTAAGITSAQHAGMQIVDVRRRFQDPLYEDETHPAAIVGFKPGTEK